MMRFGLSIVFVFTIVSSAFAGNWESITRSDFDKVMGQVGAYFDKHEKYSVEVTHTSYKGYEAEGAFDKIKGYFKKDGFNYSSSVIGIRTIQNEKLRVVVDSLNRSIIVTEPVAFKKSDMMMVNYENASSYVTAYKEMNTATGVVYRVEFNDTLPRYAAYEIELTKNDMLKDIVIYFKDSYPKDMDHPESPKTHPKVRIDFENFSSKVSFNPGEFDVSKYVNLQGNTLAITNAAYKHYRLVDARYSNFGKKKTQHTNK